MEWQKVNKSKGIPALETDCIVLCKDGTVHRAQRKNGWFGGWRTGYGNKGLDDAKGSCLDNVTHFVPFKAPTKKDVP